MEHFWSASGLDIGHFYDLDRERECRRSAVCRAEKDRVVAGFFEPDFVGAALFFAKQDLFAVRAVRIDLYADAGLWRKRQYDLLSRSRANGIAGAVFSGRALNGRGIFAFGKLDTRRFLCRCLANRKNQNAR